MVTTNIENLIKSFDSIVTNDLVALEHIIHTKEQEVESYNIRAQRNIAALKTILGILKKKFNVTEVKSKVPLSSQLQRIKDFLSAQDFPVSAQTIAKSLEIPVSNVYYLTNKHKATIRKTDQGYALIQTQYTNGQEIRS